jgi:hypothetical protein
VLIANGGTGGRGQNGGQGGKGKTGSPGLNDKTEAVGRLGMGARTSHVVQVGTAGGKGNKGGKGGCPGARGHHGHGGTALLHLVQPCVGARLEARPGQALRNPQLDPDAERGKGGPGGDGGVGGIDYSDNWSFKTKRHGPGATGDEGDKGDDAKTQTRDGREGTTGCLSIGYGELGAEFARAAPQAEAEGSSDGTLLSLLLATIERRYLEACTAADLTAVQAGLAYLQRLTAPPRPADASPRLAAIHARCKALAGNLARGLDLFGQSPDFVPSLDLEENKRFFLELAAVARAVEADRDRLLDRARDTHERTDALQLELDRRRKQIDDDNHQRERLSRTVNELDLLIASLTTLALEKKTEAVAALETFKDRLADQQALQAAIGTLKIAWSAVSICMDGAPLLTEGLPLLKELLAAPAAPATIDNKAASDNKTQSQVKEPPKDDHKAHVVAAFGKVKGDVETIVRDYGSHFDKRSWDDDSIKFFGEGLDKASFQARIDKFLDVSGAAELKTLVGEYLDLTEKRNKLIVERDAALQQANTLEGQLQLAAQDAARLQLWRERTVAPGLPALLQYLGGSVQQSKARLIAALHMMARSVGYCTLSSVPMVLQDDRVSMLETQYAAILAAIHDAHERLGMPTRAVRSVVIESGPQLQRLKNGKPVWISIPVNTNRPPTGPFANLEQPFVFDVECHLDGAVSRSGSPKAYATATITHTGTSFACNESIDPPRVLSFTHRRRTVQFQTTLASGKKVMPESGDFTDRGRFMPLSPFAVWGVQYRPEENPDLDLSGVKRVELRFGVRGIGKDVG